MRILRVEPRDEWVPIWATGDWHIGHVNHASALFTAHSERAFAEKWNVLHIGDALEMVTPTSRVALRGATREQILTITEQRKMLRTILKRLPGGVMLPGNHEWRIDMATGLDFIADVVDGTQIQPLDGPDFVRLTVGKQIYTGFLHHGEGPAVNPLTLLDRIQRDVEGVDFILAGHIHRQTLDETEALHPDGVRVIHRIRVGHYLVRPMYFRLRPGGPTSPPGSILLWLNSKTHAIRTENLRKMT